MKRVYTIYALVNPINNEFFYVGQTAFPEVRIEQHYKCRINTRKWEYIQSIGQPFTFMKLEEGLMTYEASLRAEYKWYQLIKSCGFNLTNNPNAIRNPADPAPKLPFIEVDKKEEDPTPAYYEHLQAIFTIPELAKYFKLSEAWVSKQVKRYNLNHIKSNGKVYFTRPMIEQFFHLHKIPA